MWAAGLSLVSQVAPARAVSLIMGLWLGTAFIGDMIAGWFDGLWGKMDDPNLFFLMAALATAAGVVVTLLSRPLNSIVERRAVG